MECNRVQIFRRGYRLDMPATALLSKLHEVVEKPVRQALPARGHSDGNRMHVSHRLGLRNETKQVRDDLGFPANHERRVSKLVNQERVVQVTDIPRTPEFM